MSRSSIESESSSRGGERTPFRSLENKILQSTTPLLRLGSKSQLSSNTGKLSMARLSSSPFVEGRLTDDAQTVCGPEDITFKTFICSGGEVEIPGASDYEDESLILPNDGVTFTTELEDTVAATSMSGEHVEHPYFSSGVRQLDSGGVCDIPSSVLPAGDDENHFSWRSLAGDGGEVEVPDSPGLQKETIPLPHNDLWDPSQDDTADPADCTQTFPGQHVDHVYFIRENDTVSETQRYENTIDGSVDLTLKSFICPGGELVISEEAEASHETIPPPDSSSGCYSLNHTSDPSMLAGDADLEAAKYHLEHPYCDPKYNCSLPSDHLNTVQNPQLSSAGESKQIGSMLPDVQEEDTGSFKATVEDPGKSEHAQVSLTEDKQTYSRLNDGEFVLDDRCPFNESPLSKASLKAVDDDSDDATEHPEDAPLPSAVHRNLDVPDGSHLDVSVEAPLQEAEQQPRDYRSCSTSQRPECGETKDSALGSFGPALCNSADKAPEASPDIWKVLSEFPTVASALQFLSPIVKRASLSVPKFLTEDSVLESEKSLVAPVNVDPAGLFAEHLESPMPRPLFNSTVLGLKPQQPCSSAEPNACSRKPESDVAPLIPDGQLQQQLRQMAEFLIMACGKMSSGSAAFAPPPSRAGAPAESHSVCVGTSPLKTMDHSLNTSGIFVRKREFSVADSCTDTDPLIWNLAPGSLDSLPRQDLQQRLMSSMIMVEALLQQLAAARVHRRLSSGPPPSDLREKQVQTDHTELSQTTMYRDLYMEALSRIGELELDEGSLQNLVLNMQNMRATMSSLSSDTDAALSNMKQMSESAREDHQSLLSHYKNMKSLFEKSKETQTRMLEKVKEVLNQRNDMKIRMEEALTDKEAAFSVMDQLRTHCASEISLLEKCVGSQRELLAALGQVYPDQVALSKACHETLTSAGSLLSQTVEEHSSLMNELCTTRSLLRKTVPSLVLLKEKAADALRERDEHRSETERAVKEREQVEEELRETLLNFQTASQQISDLNLQITILTSEMGILRQKLTDKDGEKGQLERKVTELSATVSSTLASYTFLEQALADETTKLQEAWKDVHQANGRANELEASLEDSERRVCELNRVLAESDEELGHLQNLSQSQSVQIQRLKEACAQLGNVLEMNEFLQMENDLAREQVAESERMLRTNLQSLRERNIECEDLKSEVCELQVENESLCEKLESATSAASAARLELQEKTAQVVSEITVLHHTLRGLIKELQASLSDQREEEQRHKERGPLTDAERQHTSSSFVDSVMMALTAEKEEDVRTDSSSVPSDASEPLIEALFSETSAFMRVAAPLPKSSVQGEDQEEEEQSGLAEVLSGLGGTVTELISALRLLQRSGDAQLQELHTTIGGLQVAQRTSDASHEAEVLDLRQELRRLNTLVERGNQALHHKAQDEKTLTKLMADVQEAQEILSKHKSDNNELRKDVVELRRALQQSRVESQFLREELTRAFGPAAVPVHHMEEKLRLLKEVERMKASLQEAEQAKVKLLERAKRHQIIHQTNQQKSENELQILNHMINKVRETLFSLPEVVKRCEQLQQLVNYIG